MLILSSDGCSASTQLIGLLEDAERFIVNYRLIIEQAPLQAYAAGLGFCPSQTEIRRLYWDERAPFVENIMGIRTSGTRVGRRSRAIAVRFGLSAFSPDGKTIASASSDQTIRVWDAATGTPRQTLEGHSDWVRAVAFSPDGKTIASASDDQTIRVWDAATGTPRQTLEGHSGSIWAVAFSPDGKTIASASSDQTIRVWDAATGTPRQTLEGP